MVDGTSLLQRRGGLQRVGGLAAVVGTVFLLVYFTVPAASGWPYAGGTPPQLAAYASDHRLLFFAGGWFQAVGSALCILFVLAVLQLAGTTVTVAFALSNGVFARIFPLIPAPMLFAGLGLAGRGVLGPVLARGALILAVAFVAAGALAVATPVGLFAGIGLSVLQAFWFLTAGIRLLRRTPAS